ncbi:hypothetical protein GCM10010448_46620 [Streptomyces glomeratus]|uniref:Uncharacterized protein n=1 Tax=Streptomyces glomeratus TaxID=284452 RepID=A0ABP6LSD1_9ACTN
MSGTGLLAGQRLDPPWTGAELSPSGSVGSSRDPAEPDGDRWRPAETGYETGGIARVRALPSRGGRSLPAAAVGRSRGGPGCSRPWTPALSHALRCPGQSIRGERAGSRDA